LWRSAHRFCQSAAASRRISLEHRRRSARQLVLFPILSTVLSAAVNGQWMENNPDAYVFVLSLWRINAGLLIFNLLPIYPLDGGQIVRGLLWFAVGRVRSLKISSVIGFGLPSFGLGLPFGKDGTGSPLSDCSFSVRPRQDGDTPSNSPSKLRRWAFRQPKLHRQFPDSART